MFLRITHSLVQISLIPELICSPGWHVTSLWPHSPLNNGASLIIKITMFKCFGVLAFNPYLLTSVHSSEQPFTSQFSSSSSLHRLFFFMVWTSNFNEDTCKEGFHSRGQQLCKLIGTKESFTFYINKRFNSQRIGFEHQHGRRFIVFEHQYGDHVKRFYNLIISLKDNRKPAGD